MSDLVIGLTVGAFGLLAVLVGSPLTRLVFWMVDRSSSSVEAEDADGSAPEGEARAVRAAADALRGGLWIGLLERAAIYAAVLAGSDEAIVGILAVKALGRYPELRHGDNPVTAERFIIGTFVSVLWAAACAGLTVLVLSA